MANPGQDHGGSRAWIAVIAALVLLALAWAIFLRPGPVPGGERAGPPPLNAAETDLPAPVGSLDHPVPVHLTDGDPRATDRVPPPPSPLSSPSASPASAPPVAER